MTVTVAACDDNDDDGSTCACVGLKVSCALQRYLNVFRIHAGAIHNTNKTETKTNILFVCVCACVYLCSNVLVCLLPVWVNMHEYVV